MLKELFHALATVLGALSLQPAAPSQPAPSATPQSVQVQPLAPELALPAPAQPPDSVAAPRGIEQPVDRQLQFARIHLPKGFGADSAGQCDLVLHFHGAYTTIVPAFDTSKLHAGLIVVNLGDSASLYSDHYSDRNALDRALLASQRALDALVDAPHRCKIGRVALSAWSAGGSAVKRLLKWPQVAERVDAILIGDGMHAQYADPKARRIEPSGMQPLVAFAQLAMTGSKLMVVTHSAVETLGYASTTRSASFLLDQLDLAPEQTDTEGPREMRMRYRADKGDLHVKGYKGGDATAHCDHLREFDALLFQELQTRWSTLK